MDTYLILKALHLLSATFFIGCVYMRALVIPGIEPAIGKDSFKKVKVAMEKPSRAFGRVSNAILALTGIGLFLYHMPSATIGVYIKVALGTLLILLFFTAPLFTNKGEARFPGFKQNFHIALLVLMVALIFCVVWVFG